GGGRATGAGEAVGAQEGACGRVPQLLALPALSAARVTGKGRSERQDAAGPRVSGPGAAPAPGQPAAPPRHGYDGGTPGAPPAPAHPASGPTVSARGPEPAGPGPAPVSDATVRHPRHKRTPGTGEGTQR
ncbi:hypothetical protein JQK87_37345, partial [Streptomyces sp. G44]|nr:hypothetical protein [Streptomyces sp. G44]